MSYLNRVNGYAPTGRVNGEPSHVGKHRRKYRKSKDTHVQVGKVKHTENITEPWWVDCPVCPLKDGFSKHVTHGRALTWALAHVERHRKDLVTSVLVAARKGGIAP